MPGVVYKKNREGSFLLLLLNIAFRNTSIKFAWRSKYDCDRYFSVNPTLGRLILIVTNVFDEGSVYQLLNVSKYDCGMRQWGGCIPTGTSVVK